ncbi:EscU/YscU/HrcU family type III secretion system export apparatus switch protein, partial [Vibrio parahaemolyticus]|nr:EscU/YscU/HrcU family type III secretion system export apparatus switch protein [Vibrio parahaemolyticus]
IMIVTLGISIGVGGWMFRPANMFPQLSKLTPHSGIKRIFSTRSLVELVTSTIKVTVIFGILYGYLDNHRQPLLGIQ